MARLDTYLSDRGFFSSRERAKQAIISGGVSVNGAVVTKPACDVSDEDDIILTVGEQKYVGRGGFKLEGAIEHFKIDLKGLTCADFGASTGGFTDCMLRYGAKKVFSSDVGHGQLDEKLLSDSRVVNIEGVNVKDIDENTFFDDIIDFVAADLSFISVKFAITAAQRILSSGKSAVFLIKPQFEAGKSAIGKHGIVKDKSAHVQVLKDVFSYANGVGFAVIGIIPSPIKGGDGNREYLMYCEKDGTSEYIPDFKRIACEAFSID